MGPHPDGGMECRRKYAGIHVGESIFLGLSLSAWRHRGGLHTRYDPLLELFLHQL